MVGDIPEILNNQRIFLKCLEVTNIIAYYVPYSLNGLQSQGLAYTGTRSTRCWGSTKGIIVHAIIILFTYNKFPGWLEILYIRETFPMVRILSVAYPEL